ncbi:hypothetical protein [Streptomyces sp. PAM3C]|uniref:hypothetical protein n=1 Tax=Streptomyces sp. PAM3C TaxID=2847300 RepID=UPI0020A628D4|nr:hypothetical protein [Streptomyces sp. PAM3C]
MLSYLAAALPVEVSAAARLVAVQCALRMDSRMCVRLPVGILRSLRLSTTPRLWQELEQARWLLMFPDQHTGVVRTELRDPALLGQSPSRPDRQRAADWALRAGRTARAAGDNAVVQLMNIHIAAHSDPATGRGQEEADRLIRACGVEGHDAPKALDRLSALGFLEWWLVCPDTGDVHWSCGAHTA